MKPHLITEEDLKGEHTVVLAAALEELKSLKAVIKVSDGYSLWFRVEVPWNSFVSQSLAEAVRIYNQGGTDAT